MIYLLGANNVTPPRLSGHTLPEYDHTPSDIVGMNNNGKSFSGEYYKFYFIL